jgi:hypothetical protein
MNKYTISMWFRDVVSCFAIKAFLWANKLTEEEYFNHIFATIQKAKEKE